MDAETTVIGAGVLGLAVAREISQQTRGVFVVEKNLKFGQETSSRNSEVIHSGIYYPEGYLKGKLCVEGREMLYDFMNKYGIAHRRCGKLVVATNREEEKQLAHVLKVAKRNGVTDGVYLKPEEMAKLEPHVRATGALFFPSTGILDTHGLMKQLESLAKLQGTEFVYGARVTGIEKLQGGYLVHLLDADGQEFSFSSRRVVNSAGLEADKVAAMAGTALPGDTIRYWKGQYFRVTGNKHKLLQRPVYPVPSPDYVSLGLHSTTDLSGQLRLGPDAVYLPRKEYDYSIDPGLAKQFCESVKPFLPFIEEADLVPDQAGIRPKLQQPGDAERDYEIREESKRGFPGWVNLIGMESPALTSCLAIAKFVRKLINE